MAISLDRLGKSKILRPVVAGLVLLMVALDDLRMFSHRSPTIDVLGSYFPAWMLCILSGLTLTLVFYWVVRARHLKDYVGPGAVIYPCLILIFTFSTWILLCQD